MNSYRSIIVAILVFSGASFFIPTPVVAGYYPPLFLDAAENTSNFIKTASNRSNVSSQTTDCLSNNCVGSGSSEAVRTGHESDSSGIRQFAQVVSVKRNSSNGIYWGACYLPFQPEAQGGSVCGQVSEGGYSYIGAIDMLQVGDIPNDNNWHTLVMAVRENGGYFEMCYLIDDLDINHCSWSNTMITSSQIDHFYGIGFGYESVGTSIRFDNFRGLTIPSPFYARIKNTPTGTFNLRSGSSTSSTIIKTLPEDWIVYVASTSDQSGSPILSGGFQWYQVTDPTDGVSGWMAGQNASGTIEYLPYDSGNQATFEADSSDYVATSSRAAVILNALDNYYSTSTGNSLYDSTSGISDLAAGFPKQVIPGIAAAEDGASKGGYALGFNNENISTDYGHGVMQLTLVPGAWDNRGTGSKIDIPECEGVSSNLYLDCYTSADPGGAQLRHYKIYGGTPGNPTYKYYTNTNQSFYANVKDGLQNLSEKYSTYNYITTSATVGSTTYSADDRKDILATENYNGNDCATYIGSVVDKLDNITTYFPTASTSTIADLMAKMHIVAGDNTICAQLHSPAELTIYGPEGQTAGVINGKIQNSFPLAVVDKKEKLVKILAAQDGNYTYKVVGTGKGVYGFDIILRIGKQETEFHATGIPTKPGETHIYSVNKAALAAGRADAVTVQIDSDGDGKIERVVKSGPTLNSRAFSLKQTSETQ